MNSVPTILTDQGFEVDNNGVLTEMVIPSTVKTLNAPTKVTFMGTTLSAIPPATTALQEFEAPNATTVSSSSGLFIGYTVLHTIKLNAVESISGPFILNCNNLTTLSLNGLKSLSGGSVSYGVIDGCAGLTTLNFPSLETLTCTGNAFMIFKNLPVSSLNFPNVKTVADTHGASTMFYSLGNLTTLNFPVIESIKGRIFISLTSLQNVTLGSVGHPVQSIVNGSGGSVFQGCTQSGLTITIYTTNGASLSGSPWGATNATIVYEEA